MEKHFCDICEGEIKPGELRGGFMRLKKDIKMVPAGPKGELAPQEILGEEPWEFCEECTDWVAELIKKRKDEVSKSQ